MIHLGYPRGMQIPTALTIPGYPWHPPSRIGLNPQGYKTLQQDPNQ